eukprot:3284133-Rhodomonas_salina.3
MHSEGKVAVVTVAVVNHHRGGSCRSEHRLHRHRRHISNAKPRCKMRLSAKGCMRQHFRRCKGPYLRTKPATANKTHLCGQTGRIGAQPRTESINARALRGSVACVLPEISRQNFGEGSELLANSALGSSGNSREKVGTMFALLVSTRQHQQSGCRSALLSSLTENFVISSCCAVAHGLRCLARGSAADIASTCCSMLG